MGKIFCIMGKSSSGKDSVYQELIRDKDLKLKNVVLYTTRPIRSGEKDGETYFFVTPEKRDELLSSGKVIEIRNYNTVYGVWSYFTADDGQINPEKGSCLMIGTLEAYNNLKKYFGKEAVCPIYIETEDGLRLSRALKREMAQAKPKYEEMCRRFLADQQDFSEENLKAAGIDKRFENTDFQAVVNEVKTYIRRQQDV